ncbi:MAG: hypothetical protein WBG42_00870 [Cryomorphaceae bacterium]
MKNLKLSFLVSLMIILFAGCEKDDDDDSPQGCTIICQNGGTVASSNCSCNCPAGFTGANCQNQNTPTSFTLTRIDVTDWPYFDGNLYWDSDNSAPDPRVEINLGTSPFLHSGHFENPSAGSILSYGSSNDPDNFPRTLNVNTTYDFRVYDNDPLNSDDLMLNSQFKLLDYSNGLPSVITFFYSSGWEFKLYGTWNF